MRVKEYSQSVFINCPFDPQYKPLFEAMVFAIHFAGFTPRCALETADTAQFRLAKILDIIAGCKYGIHDISRIEIGTNRLPRFNMPLELGLDLGCRYYGLKKLRSKRLLVMDKKPYRYQKFLSDIAGQDIRSHFARPKQIIRQVRDWLSTESKEPTIPGGSYMYNRYRVFRNALPKMCGAMRLEPNRLTFGDFSFIVRTWLEESEV